MLCILLCALTLYLFSGHAVLKNGTTYHHSFSSTKVAEKLRYNGKPWFTCERADVVVVEMKVMEMKWD